MLRKLPLIPERRLRVLAAFPRVAKGVLIQVLRNISGKAPFVAHACPFTIFFNYPQPDLPEVQ